MRDVRDLNMPSLSPFRSALTLVELLIVFGILTLLFLIMFFVGREVRYRIYEIRCFSNMKQLHLAVICYLNDNEDIFPAYLSEVFPYVRQYDIFYCSIWYALFGEGKSFEQLWKEARHPSHQYRYGYVPAITNNSYRLGPDPEGQTRTVEHPFEYYYAQRGDDIPLIYCWYHERPLNDPYNRFDVKLVVRMNGRAEKLILPVAKSGYEAKDPHEW